MTHYSTLDAALDDIAKRSFYYDATVTPESDGYTVADDYATSFPDDVLLWDDVTGVDWPTRADDHSRLHDPAEYYASAEHIRYNLSTAVEALEEGQAVTFAYAIVDAECEEEDIPGAHAASQCLNCDSAGWQTAGWALLAAIHN